MSNPFESPSGETVQTDRRTDSAELARRPSRWLTVPVGAIGGGLLAAMVAFGLAFVVLIPPTARFFGLGGEFDGLWLWGIPIFASPCGLMGGLVYGGTWKWQRGYAIAMTFASLPAAAYFLANAWDNEMTKKPRDVFVSTVVISTCMVLSVAIALKLIGMCFTAIARYRTTRPL